ncbi:hypothetical protein N7539_000168 [Penicillium diatomitis]|uniref:Uncharacterized protein n=1 Tax=Penicillium diatomitis TaxID=2819901 RepID=A0A9X0C1Z7_9EURO|nr:uncharacterized protein N7539_000168 [Penicillium diatomitis]KAJ5495052.1 hypothetical protein N7539_000168 [Penicillium diatomitis]
MSSEYSLTMEPTTSPRASRIRRAFPTFHLGRECTATRTPSGVTDRSSSHPRSVTTPGLSHVSSPVATEPTCHSPTSDSGPDASRHYGFLDKPGLDYSDPSLISRQWIEEDLLDDLKYACAVLLGSIERGIPIWPAVSINASSVQDAYEEPEVCMAPNAYREQTATRRAHFSRASQVSLPDVRTHPVYPHTSGGPRRTKMYDSGVAFQDSATMASSPRFYGQHTFWEEDQRGRSRMRGLRSQAPVTTNVPATRSPRFYSRSHDWADSRSRSTSPEMYMYSPPQVDTLWPDVKGDESFEESISESFAEKQIEVGAFGVDGASWLHQGGLYYSQRRSDGAEKAFVGTVEAHSPLVSPSAPCRFYSMQSPAGPEAPNKGLGQHWSISDSRTPSVSDVESGSDRYEALRDDHFSQVDRVTSPAAVATEASTALNEQRRRWRKASTLLRKLTGFGRKKHVEALETQRVAVAV